MKRIGLALACFAFAGTAGAAIVAIPPTSGTVTAISQEAVSASPDLAAAATSPVESRRAPVPYVPRPKAPFAQLASVEPTVVVVPESGAAARKPDLARATVKEVRDLSEAQCGGRAMKSITVLGDGTLKVQC
ncbi:MAG: hypothetical protein KIS73_25115 [Enhydrobacter sp.]|nr:hypothetical protein [Enhydrobacter sp.]